MKDYRKFISQLSLPYLGTPPEVIPEIFNTLKEKFNLMHNSSQRLIDLGSGNGRIIIYSAIHYKIKSVGIEIDKILIDEAKETIKSLKKKKEISRKLIKLIKFRNDNLFLQKLHDYDYIYIFSLPSMQKSLNHVFKTAKSQAIIISFKYELKGFENYLNFEYCLKIKYNDKIWEVYFYRKI
jgi:16S rRNA G966 N2-methylase RsmD